MNLNHGTSSWCCASNLKITPIIFYTYFSLPCSMSTANIQKKLAPCLQSPVLASFYKSWFIGPKKEVTEPRPGLVCDHFLVPAGSVSKITVSPLTVGTSVGLQPQSHPPVGVPVGRDEPQEASDNRLLQFVLNHAVCIAVAGKGLDNTETARGQCVKPWRLI